MLGSDLAKEFAGHDLTAWDAEEIDITKKDEVLEKVLELKPELIINAAAYTNVDGAEEERAQAFEVNEAGAAHLAAAAKELDATIVHYSTDYVFSGEKEEGYGEDDAPEKPVNAYGESKLAGEQALQASGAKFYLVRTAWLYGSAAEPTSHKNFVATMLKLASDRDELNVVDDQHGGPTFTKDLAQYTKKLVEENYELGIYHATGLGVTTWCGFAKKIFELAETGTKVNPIASQEFPTPAKRPQWSVLLNKKGPQMRAWEEALAEYVSLFTNYNN